MVLVLINKMIGMTLKTLSIVIGNCDTWNKIKNKYANILANKINIKLTNKLIHFLSHFSGNELK